MRLLNAIVDAIAHLVHPGRPREFFENVVLPSDITTEEVATRLDQAAAGNPEKLKWRTSVVDLMKLCGMRADFDNRKQLAEDLNYEGDYTGSADQNTWLHGKVFAAIQQRGIKLPTA